jgi:adenosylmethionine-8-amino-7-oxononanoate aminotransferase/4-aminobutyrate--pyruvate transaminase
MVDDNTALTDPAADADAHLWHPWSPVQQRDRRFTPERGKGCWVWDTDGNRYIDAVAAALNSTCGHSEEALISAAVEQLRLFPHYDLSEASHRPAEQLAARLAGLLPDDLNRVLFVNSGSEAAEAAVRIAADHWKNVGAPRTHVVTFARGYHGSTALAQHLSGLGMTETGFDAPFPISRVEWPPPIGEGEGSAALLERFAAVVDDRTAAVIVEPLLNVGGGVLLPEGFLCGLREVCNRTGSLLIVDEVFTGFGRTGRMFGFEHDGITPDVVMLSKGISSGYMPLGAVVARTGIHRSFANDPFIGGLRYGHTTGGHAVACAVGLRTLDLIEERGLVGNTAAMGAELLDSVKPLAAAPPVVDVRGLGLVVVMELSTAEDARRLLILARQRGLLLKCQQNAVMAVAPLVIGSADVEELSRRWAAAVDALAEEKMR